ncbi:MAG: NUDIX hydrolase [Bacteroidetes bacterium B1(2017)]|nr:MAG: NUDIX hydrolase [Bacteroidetes bacterium B1(2017)]
MYKFFINDKPLIITSSEELIPRFQQLRKVSYTSAINLMDLVRQIEDPQSTGCVLICEDSTEVFMMLKSNFTTIHAGGGIVFNSKKELLIMKRLGKWDLPKGKIDPGETIEEGAKREVEEECGINELKIERFFENSYHTYKLQGHRFLKATHWYLMETGFEGNLVPQLEESITEVKWVDLSEIDLSTYDTYESIREILIEVQSRK